jgi:hypothetical protein
VKVSLLMVLAALSLAACADGDSAEGPSRLDGGLSDSSLFDATGAPELARDATALMLPDATQGEPIANEILTNRYNNARTGVNLAEQVLVPTRLSGLRALGSFPVDGEIYAQVLVVADVQFGLSTRSLAIVATMNNSVYAFDADGSPENAQVWHQGRMKELGVAAFSARNVGGLNGILSTPVIDKKNGVVYVVSRDCDPSAPPEAPSCNQRLSQLELRTGAVLFSTRINGRVTVDAKTDHPRNVVFDPSAHWNRPGLLLSGDELYAAFGSGPAGNQHEEDFVYHGWVFRFDVRNLSKAPETFCTTPRGRGGSIWQAGAAPAADDQAVYATGANGITDDGKIHPPEDWPSKPKGQEDSVFRLPRTATLPTADDQLVQYADTRPYLPAGNVFQFMESGDNGFGSSGPMLIPGTELLLVGTKAGLVYLLNRKTMQATQEPLNPFRVLPLQPGHSLYLHSWWGIPNITQSFVFWRPTTSQDGDNFGYAYAWASNDKLRSLRFDYRSGVLAPFATSAEADLKSGGNLVLSAEGARPDSGILWVSTRSSSDEHARVGAARPVDGHPLGLDPVVV